MKIDADEVLRELDEEIAELENAFVRVKKTKRRINISFNNDKLWTYVRLVLVLAIAGLGVWWLYKCFYADHCFSTDDYGLSLNKNNIYFVYSVILQGLFLFLNKVIFIGIFIYFIIFKRTKDKIKNVEGFVSLTTAVSLMYIISWLIIKFALPFILLIWPIVFIILAINEICRVYVGKEDWDSYWRS